MAENTAQDHLLQLDNLLGTAEQSWLLGSGISLGANIPLMASLTARVLALANSDGGQTNTVVQAVNTFLPDGATIEETLSQLADHAAIATRSKTDTISIGDLTVNLAELQTVHDELLTWIAATIRWGYREGEADESEEIGSSENLIVSIDEHVSFVHALLTRSQAGIGERRGPIKLFTTN